jgi:S-DNA-T family DNA segregation ATPase FtsK/SpoIIIE
MKDNRRESRLFSQILRHRLYEGFFLIASAAALFLIVSLLTYSTQDPGWSATGLSSRHVMNWGGRVGAFLADVLLSLFGLIAYLFPPLCVAAAWFGLNRATSDTASTVRVWPYRFAGWCCSIISLTGLASYFGAWPRFLPTHAGGIAGDLTHRLFTHLFNPAGGALCFMTLFLFGVTLLTGMSWVALTEAMGAGVLRVGSLLVARIREKIKPAAKVAPTKLALPRPMTTPSVAAPKAIKREEPLIDEVVLPPIPKITPSLPSKTVSTIQLSKGALPPCTLLNASPQAADQAFTSSSFEALSSMVEQRLADFGVEARVVAVLPGPVVTRFELDLAPGIKVSKITGLAKDIARSLSVVSVRVVEVIPGKSVIGLEIPNQHRELVTLRDILESPRYTQSHTPVGLALGKDISGNPVVVDLTKMPHLLVAGTTGSGKSVALNAMLLSLLFKATPEQLRLILIDPKMLELSIYDGIPHLLTPVITDMKDASNALRWCVAEMDRRYRLMASQGVRHLMSYNQKVSEAIKKGAPIPLPHALVVDEETAKQVLEPLPLIVVVADELADMMMLVGKKVEDLIARLAQKARAAGIHLILATQRPSVDVITGLIKANIPTRIAFQVSSRIDSRTILDQQGAEQLLGHGDMLYLPPGAGVPIRVHGAYVADEEVHRVVAAWRSAGEPTYLHEVTEERGEGVEGNKEEFGEADPLYDEAVQIVMESRRASISLVQRRLRIGYNRAARMMEEMEKRGLVSGMDQNGFREVLSEESGI